MISEFDYLVLVNGTDFTLGWGENQMRISCYKFKEKPGLWYEIGVCVSTIKRHCVLLCGLAGRIFPDYITIY